MKSLCAIWCILPVILFLGANGKPAYEPEPYSKESTKESTYKTTTTYEVNMAK